MVQVMLKVPAVGNVIVFVLPGEKSTPLAEENSLGAPAAAVNVPCVPVTRLWTPPGSLKVTDCPALMVTFALRVKADPPLVIVAAPPPPLPVVAGGALVPVVAVGEPPPALPVEVVSPQAASVSSAMTPRIIASFRIVSSAFLTELQHTRPLRAR